MGGFEADRWGQEADQAGAQVLSAAQQVNQEAGLRLMGMLERANQGADAGGVNRSTMEERMQDWPDYLPPVRRQLGE